MAKPDNPVQVTEDQMEAWRRKVEERRAARDLKRAAILGALAAQWDAGRYKEKALWDRLRARRLLLTNT